MGTAVQRVLQGVALVQIPIVLLWGTSQDEGTRLCEDTGLRYSGRAAQQGCGDSERGISSRHTSVLTVIQSSKDSFGPHNQVKKVSLEGSLKEIFFSLPEKVPCWGKTSDTASS